MANIEEVAALEALQKSLKGIDTIITSVDNKIIKLNKDLAALQKTVEGNTTSTDGLEKAQKKSKTTAEEVDKVGKQLASTEEKLKQLDDARSKSIIKNNEAIRTRKKEIKDSLVLDKEDAKTKEQLRVKNGQLRKELDKVQVAHFKNRKERKLAGAEVKRLTKAIDENDKVLKKNSDNLIQDKINIGNYGSAFGGILGPISAAGAALKKFLANPVVAVLAAIAALFTLVAKSMKRSEDGQDRLNKVMVVAASIWDNILDIVTLFGVALFDTFPKMLQKVGISFQRFVLGMQKGFVKVRIAMNKALGRSEKVKEFQDQLDEITKKQEGLKETSKELGASIKGSFAEAIAKAKGFGDEVQRDIALAKELADIEAAFNREERRAIVENAKLARDSAKLRTEAEQLKKIAAEDGMAVLEESFKLDEKILVNELKLARMRADIAKRQSNLAVDDIEAKKGIADAEAEIFNVEKRFEELRRQRTRRLNILRMEAFKQEEDRAKAGIETAKNNAAELLAINDEIADNELMNIDERTAALEENAAIRAGFADAELTIAVAALDKEKELKLKSEENYNIELEALTSKRNAEIVKADEETNAEVLKMKDDLLQAQIEQSVNQARAEADLQINIARLTIKNEEDLAQRIFEIEKDLLGEQLDNLQVLLDATEEGTIKREKLEGDLAAARVELDDIVTDKALENRDKIKDQIVNSADRIKEVGTEIFDLRSGFIDLELSKVEQQKAGELAAAEGNKAQQAKIELKFAKQLSDIKNKQAKNDKAKALFDIGIGIPVAALNALKIDPTGILAGIVTGLGLIQLGIVAAKPVPKFAKGTSKAPGEFIAGDAGRELMRLPSGKMQMVDQPTYFRGSTFKGSKIFNNKETEEIMSQTSHSGFSGFSDSGMLAELRGLRKDVRNGSKPIVDRAGNVIGVKERGSITKFVNTIR